MDKKDELSKSLEGKQFDFLFNALGSLVRLEAMVSANTEMLISILARLKEEPREDIAKAVQEHIEEQIEDLLKNRLATRDDLEGEGNSGD